MLDSKRKSIELEKNRGKTVKDFHNVDLKKVLGFDGQVDGNWMGLKFIFLWTSPFNF